MSSAEQQRMQFQKEREEIELQRQKLKATEVSGARPEAKPLSFHDETDMLMDELAGNSSNSNRNGNNGNNGSNGSSNNIQKVEQQSLKNIPLQGAMRGTENRTQTAPQPQGMKKISINNLFSSAPVPAPSSSVSFGAPPGIALLPNSGHNIVPTGVPFIYAAKNDIEPDYMGDFSMGSGTGADEDYEMSMRLIERMVFDDDDDDKNGQYDVAKIQPSSRYTFSDPPAIAKREEILPSSVPQFNMNVSGSSRFAVGQSLNVTALFAAARSQEEQGNPSPQYTQSYLSPRSPMDGSERRDRSGSFDVLSKLGHDAQSPSSRLTHDAQRATSFTPQSPSSRRLIIISITKIRLVCIFTILRVWRLIL